MTDQLQSFNPSDGTLLWEGAAATPELIRRAVERSRAAFAGWSGREFEERSGILRQFGKVLGKRREELAALIAREIGKPLWEARTEVAAMAGKVDISITAYRQRCSEFTGGRAVTRFRPHGVLVVIGPYNFPGHLPNGHICPALLAGNTILFKPSELAPATAEFTRDCWELAGLPEDVLEVLQGGPGCAQMLVGDPGIDGVLFTGSARTGKRLASQLADSPGKVLTLEMGGNNPLIVDSGHVAMLKAAARLTLHSAFLSTGQRCTCARRLVLIESANANRFLEELLDMARSLTLDDPFSEPPPFMGPLASVEFPSRILAAQESLLSAGGIPLLRASAPRPGTGFITPGIIDVTSVENRPDEEIFGPLLQVLRVPGLEAAVHTANDTRYGLAAGILTDDDDRYHYAFSRLRAGIINRNQPLTGASSAAPFGGIRDSGNLRPSAFFAADYCAYPVASMEATRCEDPPRLP